MKEPVYNEADLNTNINVLAHETLRELYIAAKKVSIYSAHHPLTQKAIGQPFLRMEKIFRFKRYCNLHISEGHFFVLNIRTKPSPFSDQIMDYMQMLDINDILFETGMTADELVLFLDRFVKRLPTTDYRNLMTTHLETNRIGTIHVNSSIGKDIYDKGYKLRGEIPQDFSVRAIAGSIIGDDYMHMANILADRTIEYHEFISQYHHDYHWPLLAYLIPEKVAGIETGTLILKLEAQFDGDKANDIEYCKRLVAALDYHPERDTILERLSTTAIGQKIDKDSLNEILPETSRIRMESSGQVDRFLEAVFDQSIAYDRLNQFEDHFGRLLRTGQLGKAQSVMDFLLENLAGADHDKRQQALLLLKIVLNLYSRLSNTPLIEHLVVKIGEYFKLSRETFEFSDLVWEIARASLSEKNYDRLTAICQILSEKRRRVDGIWNYESVAAKKAIDELNRREVISQLIKELVEGNHAHHQAVRDIMIAIGSDEVAVALSALISHESRLVRQNVLKILSELGKSSLSVFGEFMADNINFEREANRRELPDEKWYQVRNAIFVLGALMDSEGCLALRLRINDTDVRVRRAIVSALEKIKGERAADSLMVMSDDPDGEIREAAIIALGLVGTTDNIPELIDLAYRHRSEIIRIISTMGKLGGEDARKFLSVLLNDPHEQSEFTSGRSSREELKLATIKALGRIGDKTSLETIKEFGNSISKSRKLFFGESKLSKIAGDILNRKNK